MHLSALLIRFILEELLVTSYTKMSVTVKDQPHADVNGETTILIRQILELAGLSYIARYHIKH